jgi:hypothetical protein
VERQAAADQGVVGGEVVADPVALFEVALLLLVRVEVLHADVEPAPVAVGLLDGHLGLLLPREGEEAPASAKVRLMSSWSIPWPAR